MPTATPTNDDLPKLDQHELSELLKQQGKLGFSYDCLCGGRTIDARLRTYGFGEAKLTLKCPTCDPIVAALKVLQDREAEQRRRDERRDQLIRAVGPHNADCAIENYVASTPSQQQAAEAVTGRWWERQTFLVLCGNPGTGKTHLAVAGYREAQEQGVEPLFIGETEFLHLWRRAAAHRETFDGVEMLMGAGLLIFDDVGSGKYTDNSLEHLFQIIDHRSRHLLPTLLTTNLSLDALDAKWGEKIVSRILERGRSNVIRVEGENYRLRSAA